jgi:hypothetical protein
VGIVRGSTHLQPVGNLRVQLADMLHAVVEDADGLGRREGGLGSG